MQQMVFAANIQESIVHLEGTLHLLVVYGVLHGDMVV